jgi:hypothetical protein
MMPILGVIAGAAATIFALQRSGAAGGLAITVQPQSQREFCNTILRKRPKYCTPENDAMCRNQTPALLVVLRATKPRLPRAGFDPAPEHLNQERTAVDDQHLTGAVALPHKVEIGLGYLLHLSNVADGQPPARSI